MRWLIDGYNVIFRDPELRVLARTDLERARDELVRRLADSLYSRGGGITVVLDGREGGSGPARTRSRGGVRVIFSSPPETADQRIQKLIESAGGPAGARAAGWLVVATHRFERMPFLAAVKDAKLRAFVTPGQVLNVSAELTHDGSGYAITQASIATRGKTICDAVLTFSVTAFPNEEMSRQMRDRAIGIGFPMGAPADG